jgi:tRNA pseudouridine55 synthase
MDNNKNIFAIYKEKGPTSHDIINRVRRITGERRVGHAGTLDPLASGVLVVAVGREWTKKLGEIVVKEKEYIADIKLGEESATDDEEGEKFSLLVNKFISLQEIKKAADKFIGKIKQTPPVYSAIKINGKPAHRLVRAGKDVKLEPREVEIKSIEILKYEWPFLKLRVVTGPGVYIRALARDIGRELGVGGYLYELERTRVGEYDKNNALTIEELTINYKSQTSNFK